MERICVFVLAAVLLVRCAPPRQESANTTDSTTLGRYEDFSEVSPFTIKEDIRENPLIIKGQKRTVRDYMQQLYQPDTYTANAPEDSVHAPKYIITEASVLESTFFVSGYNCEKRSVLVTTRGDFIDQEFYDLLFLSQGPDGTVALADKQTFDGSQGQSSTVIRVNAVNLAQDKNCFVLEVNSATEGGDMNLHKDEWVEYYIADQRSFRSILKIQLEKTEIQDYEATQDENQNSFSELREIKIAESGANGLFDVRVTFVSKQSGSTVQEGEESYTFNGTEYVRK